jgi:predicted dehydrogenase
MKEIETNVTRRKFLGGAATAAGAAAISFPAVVQGKAAKGETIRVGLIGCGGRGTGAASQIMNSPHNTKLVAVADAFMDKAEGTVNRLKKQHGKKVVVDEGSMFAGFDAYKKVMEHGVDLVAIATPPGFRPLHFEHAVNNGLHVFMEKPVGVDGPGIRRVLAANEIAKKKSLLVAVGLQRHHEPQYKETIKRLQDGAIGDILYMRAFWNGGGVWTRPRQADQTELEYQMRNWYYFNWLCGDHITEQHIHNLDVINWLKDDFPVEANGQGGREVRGNPDNDGDAKNHGEIFDHHFVEYKYADGTRMYSQCRHIKGCFNSVSEHAYGSKGESDINRSTIFPKQGDPWRFSGKRASGHQQEQLDLIDTLVKGDIYNEGDYGAMSTLTSILGRYATYSGKTVTMDQALNTKIQLCPDLDNLAWDSAAPTKPNSDGLYEAAVPGKSRVV